MGDTPVTPSAGRRRAGRIRTFAVQLVVAAWTASSVMTAMPRAVAAAPVVGEGFVVTPGDLAFILKQIRIAERHSATRSVSNPCGTLVAQPGDGIPDAEQIPDVLTSYGLRTVAGPCNTLARGGETLGAADVVSPRHATAVSRAAEATPPLFGPPTPTTYKSKADGIVF